MIAEAQPIDNVLFQYDRDHDVLHITIGRPMISYAEEPSPGIYIRYAEEDDTLTGIVIMDYKKRPHTSIQNMLPISINFDDIDKKIDST
ncbi:DUF2283 domain-containing protein [Salicibibacter halophilus]|uniref:DUF2283 domain-containing protein n=1 Tax=Salicibibacter halophilus TaxID=2502791 RepID=A0A514LEU7_9BACI|nr:DUF2283 domain-containing protein [Salicibibacter halophilus]QDI90370.1 DUF2283 domain-containing protein [Salicibibacter halophilus]